MNHDNNPNKYLVDYLIHSYIYYIKGTSLITDAQFDYIYKKIDELWDKIDHPHKNLLKRDCLKSAYYLKESDYPTIVKSCAENLIKGELKL